MDWVPPSVTDQQPTVAKLLTVLATPTPIRSSQFITVPLSVLQKVNVFTAPGCNYSVGVGIGFNGKKFIPTEDPDDFIYGPGFAHSYDAGWQVQNQVEVFFKQDNRFNHGIYVALHLDRRPTQKTAGSTLVLPS